MPHTTKGNVHLQVLRRRLRYLRAELANLTKSAAYLRMAQEEVEALQAAITALETLAHESNRE